eukprot:gene9181-16316_t
MSNVLVALSGDIPVNEFIEELIGPFLKDLTAETLRNWLKKRKENEHNGVRDDAFFGRSRGSGRCSSLPPNLMVKVKETIMEIVDTTATAQVTSATLRPILLAVIKESEWGKLLSTDGGDLQCSRAWIRNVCHNMDLRRRVATKPAQKLPQGWEELVHHWLLQLCSTLHKNNIPPSLLLNGDQTGVFLVPVGRYTLTRQGTEAVRMLEIDDKRQLTVLLATAADGTMLLGQAIFQGKTARSLPPALDKKTLEDQGWVFDVTENHWSNMETSKRWVLKIIVAANVPPEDIRMDLRLSVIKPLVPLFLEAGCSRLTDNKDLVKNAWLKAGIDACFLGPMFTQAMKLYLEKKLFPEDEDKAPAKQVLAGTEDPHPLDGQEDDEDAALAKMRDGLQMVITHWASTGCDRGW